MTTWRAGPLALDVGGRRAPPDWFCDESPPSMSISIEPGDAGTSTDGTVEVRGTDGTARMTRGGSWCADVDFVRKHTSYRGGFDIDGARPCPTFESFMRVLASEVLLRSGGALLHASSIALDGKGYVFCGLSGAGKTTLVDGTPDGMYLTDDQSILTNDASHGILTWGTPFSGSAARRAPPISATVTALVLLSSSRPAETRLTRPTARAPVAAELLRHVCSHDRSAAAAVRALAVVEALVTSVPVLQLDRHLSTPLSEIVQGIDSLVAAAAVSGSLSDTEKQKQKRVAA